MRLTSRPATLGARSLASADKIIQSQPTAASEDQHQGDGKQCQRKGKRIRPHQPTVEVNLDDGHRHINRRHQRSHPGEQANDQKHAAKEFGKGRNITEPDWQVHMRHGMAERVERARGDDLGVSMPHHNDPQDKPHDQRAQALKAIKPAKQLELLLMSMS